MLTYGGFLLLGGARRPSASAACSSPACALHRGVARLRGRRDAGGPCRRARDPGLGARGLRDRVVAHHEHLYRPRTGRRRWASTASCAGRRQRRRAAQRPADERAVVALGVPRQPPIGIAVYSFCLNLLKHDAPSVPGKLDVERGDHHPVAHARRRHRRRQPGGMARRRPRPHRRGRHPAGGVSG